MVELPPADRVEIAEEVDHLRLPAPPEVAGQGHALVVQCFGRQPGRRERLGRAGGNDIDLTHANSLLRDKIRLEVARWNLATLGPNTAL